MQLAFIVHGTPAPQGSKTRMPGGGLVESSKAVRPWREAVRHEADRAAATIGWVAAPAAYAVTVVFTFRRPRTHYGTGRNAGTLKHGMPHHPTGRPDLDKLVRSTLDGITDAGALVDDSHVVCVYAVKCYPAGDLDSLDVPGAAITVWRLP